jgi:hypothetical protein
MTVMRELGGAMRQIRCAVGFESLDTAADTLNITARELYPNAIVRAPATAPVSLSYPRFDEAVVTGLRSGRR